MSEPKLSPRIAEMLVSHICHDLVSPVGAISNGIEFVEEMGADAGPDAMNLIGSSVRQASVTLQCFRLAYGGAGSSGNITYQDIQTAFANYIEGGRVELQWQAMAAGAVLPPDGYMKTVLNVLMLAAETIPGNGTLTIENHESGVMVTASAPRVAFKDGVEAAMTHTAAVEDLTPRTVHAYLTKVFADFYGIGFHKVAQEEGRIAFVVSWG